MVTASVVYYIIFAVFVLLSVGLWLRRIFMMRRRQEAFRVTYCSPSSGRVPVNFY